MSSLLYILEQLPTGVLNDFRLNFKLEVKTSEQNK